MKKKAHRLKTIHLTPQDILDRFTEELDYNIHLREEKEPYTYESIITLEEYNEMIYADEKLKLIQDWNEQGKKTEMFMKDFMKLLDMKIPSQSKIQAHKIMEQWNKSKQQ